MGLPHEGDDDLGWRACPGEYCRLFAFGRHVSRSSIRAVKGSITIRRYFVVLIANASGTGQMGAVAKGQRLSGEARPDHPMRQARAVLEDLVLHVQPPKGCAIVLTERPFSNPSDPNWIATVGPMVSEYARRHTAKVAELRKTDLRIDWSEVIGVDGPRRIALRHTELIDRLV